MTRAAAAFCRAVVVALLVGVSAGCAYRSGELYPQAYQTVAVPIFENRTFYRGVETDLAEALTKEIELRTPYKVVGRNVADTVLEGTITAVEQDLLERRRPGAVPQEVEVTVTAEFRWRDQRSGQVIVDRRGFASPGRYRPTSGLDERFELAQHDAVQNLARDIVSTLRSEW